LESLKITTAKLHPSLLAVVIFNDSKYGSIEWKAGIKFNRSFGVQFSNPDFTMLAESFGAKGIKIRKPEEFAPMLEKALEDGGIWIFDVEVDYSENMKLTRKLRGNICKF